ncbi:MAG: hypothetical protein V1645_00085 [archaeon]
MVFLFVDSKESEEPPLEFLLKKDAKNEDLVAKVDSDVFDRHAEIPKDISYPVLMVYQPYSRSGDDVFGINPAFADDIFLAFSKDTDHLEYVIKMVRSVKLDYAES